MRLEMSTRALFHHHVARATGLAMSIAASLLVGSVAVGQTPPVEPSYETGPPRPSNPVTPPFDPSAPIKEPSAPSEPPTEAGANEPPRVVDPSEPIPLDPAPTADQAPDGSLPAAPSLLPDSGEAEPLNSRSADATPIVVPDDLAKDPPLPSVSLPGEDMTIATLGDEAPLKAVADFTPTSFQGLEPGVSTEADAIKSLGEPLQKTELGEPDQPETVWSYALGPFPRVELTMRDGKTMSIFVKVAELPNPSDVAKQLQIDKFRGAAVLSSAGEPLGVVYPERGVMLSLRERESKDNRPAGYGVFSILLEPINAELFVTRARNTNSAKCTKRLADLDVALEFSPGHAEALGLKAQIYASIGETRKALRLAERAMNAAGRGPEWLLLSARLTAELGDLRGAQAAVKEVQAIEDLPAVLRAEAAMLQGDLLAIGGKHEEAIEHHKIAIDLAKEYGADEIDEVRRGALRVLANAHLAVANDIAWGNWRRKADVVPMWIKNGHKFADLLISREGEEPILAQRVQRLTLSAYAGFAEWIDPSHVSREAAQQAEALLAEATDPLYRQRVEWELAETMVHAVIAERRRSAYASAVEFAKVASPLVVKTQKRRELTPRESYMVGQLYFLAGSCLAVEAKSHADAVLWYEKGAPLLMQPFPPSVVADSSVLGDQLVSMGVSYWKTDRIDSAIALTRRGAKLLQEASSTPKKHEHRQPSLAHSLRIAYGNLAAMLRAAGRKDEASRWDERLTQLRRLTR